MGNLSRERPVILNTPVSRGKRIIYPGDEVDFYRGLLGTRLGKSVSCNHIIMHGSDLSFATPLATLVKVHPFWTKGRGGGRGRGASVSARFVPSGGGTDRKNSFSRFISRCLDQWLYHTTKKIIHLGLNHSFKEISVVSVFVYLFVCFSLAWLSGYRVP